MIEGLGSPFLGNGNIDGNPTFVDLAGGDLRLQSASPAIDRGGNVVDTIPFAPGFQGLPAADLAGEPRIVDGNGDGTAIVDMGAFEFQP